MEKKNIYNPLLTITPSVSLECGGTVLSYNTSFISPINPNNYIGVKKNLSFSVMQETAMSIKYIPTEDNVVHIFIYISKLYFTVNLRVQKYIKGKVTVII